MLIRPTTPDEAGVVAEVGEGVTEWSVGDRVGVCPMTRAGAPGYGYDGGFADKIVVDQLTLDASGAVMARMVGALLVGIAVICWFARNADPSVGREALVLGLFVADTLGFVVILLAQFAGLMTAFGWVFVLLWLLLAAGLGYFRFLAK